MKLATKKIVTVTADLGDIVFEATFNDRELVTVGPVKPKGGDGSGVVMTAQVGEVFLRVASALEKMRDDQSDYRGVCPVHGWLERHTISCPTCIREEEDAEAARNETEARQ